MVSGMDQIGIGKNHPVREWARKELDKDLLKKQGIYLEGIYRRNWKGIG